MTELFETVKEIIAKKLLIDADTITMESNFTNDLGADSLDLTELVMDLEQQFNVQIPDEAMKDIATVGDVVNFLSTVVK